MLVQVRGRNIEVTDALKDYIVKRVSKLERFIDNLGEALVTMTVEKESHRVELTIPVSGMIVRAEEITGDMYTSTDLVVDKIEKQILKYKGKLQKKGGRLVQSQKAALAGLVEEDEDAPRLVRTKRFAIKPMPVEEAILQMNLLGHSFFVFTDATTELVNVVYRRKDGNFGLIEPEF
ncbi:MAG: ribosome-associated translation inhibitor RaiA [Peptococcaceae bacterium]|nr:ribosome-associated translation inhibitor RaiA [Peptococcaceae bacterium]